MGDIKKPKKKYNLPSHPWQKDRMDEERVLVRDFGLRNKREVWKMVSELKRYTRQAKRLTPLEGEQVEKEKKQLLTRLAAYGLLPANSDLSDVLTLTPRDLMERRLQTVLVKKNLARSMKQARQFIVHRHVLVSGKSVSVPSYMVRVDEENDISFIERSALANEMHPERAQPEPVAVPQASEEAAQNE